MGLMEGIWIFTGIHTPKGNIGRYSDEDIALWMEYPEDRASEMVAALVECEWLDIDQVHRLTVHDWSEHAENWVHLKLQKARLLFIDGQRPHVNKHLKLDGNPDQRRRDREFEAGGKPSIHLRRLIYQRDNFECVICRSMSDLTLDHIIPLVLGGRTEEMNLQTMCRGCNSRKGARVSVGAR
jgi:hypothetical protein